MRMTEEQVDKALQNAAAEAIQSARNDIDLITKEINLGFDDNKVTKVQYSVTLKATMTISLEQMKVTSTGAYSAATANLGGSGSKVVMDLVHPDQPDLGMNTDTPPAPPTDTEQIGD